MHGRSSKSFPSNSVGIMSSMLLSCASDADRGSIDDQSIRRRAFRRARGFQESESIILSTCWMLNADDGLARSVVSPGRSCSEFLHTDSRPVKLTVTVGAYAWHRRHHLVHIGQLILRRAWG